MSGKRILALFAVWSVPGLLAAAQVQALYNPPPPLVATLAWQVPPWWCWVPATLAIEKLTAASKRWQRVAGVLLVVAAAALANAGLQFVFGRLFADQGLFRMSPLPAAFLILQKFALMTVLAAVCTVAWVRARRFAARLEVQELAASRLEAALGRAQLEVLRGQLQPHFLFNTLNAIRVLVRQGRAEEGEALIGQLSDLLRLVLRQGQKAEVPLREELAFVDHYLRIQRARFPDRLSYEVSVPHELLDSAVPSLLLQPLLENAVEHGVLPRIEPSKVRLSARREGAQLLLEVADDGAGLPAEINEGVGLRNVRERLEHLYPAAHSFELGPAAAGGAICRVRLPFRSVG